MKVYIGPYRKNRKISVDVHEHDTFSLDHTLALIIAPSLKKFKESRKKMPGVPITFFEDTDALDEHGNYTEESENLAESRYMMALDKMIWSMEEIANNFPGEKEILSVDDKEGYTKYHEKIQEGLVLFGKHFSTLWW